MHTTLFHDAAMTEKALDEASYASRQPPVRVALSMVPWPTHLTDLRLHPGDIALQIIVTSPLLPEGSEETCRRNDLLGEAVTKAVGPHIDELAKSLAEALAQDKVVSSLREECAMLSRHLCQEREISGRRLAELDAISAKFAQLHDQQARLRTWAGRLLLGGAATVGAAALSWLWWDALRPLAAYLPGTRTCLEVLAVLVTLLVLSRRRRGETTFNWVRIPTMQELPGDNRDDWIPIPDTP